MNQDRHVWASVAIPEVGDLAQPRQCPSLDGGPLTCREGGHSDKFMTNTGIINLL